MSKVVSTIHVQNNTLHCRFYSSIVSNFTQLIYTGIVVKILICFDCRQCCARAGEKPGPDRGSPGLYLDTQLGHAPFLGLFQKSAQNPWSKQ